MIYSLIFAGMVGASGLALLPRFIRRPRMIPDHPEANEPAYPSHPVPRVTCERGMLPPGRGSTSLLHRGQGHSGVADNLSAAMLLTAVDLSTAVGLTPACKAASGRVLPTAEGAI